MGTFQIFCSVCRRCHALVGYCGNTTNVAAHLARHNLDVKCKANFQTYTAAATADTQRNIVQTTQAVLKKQNARLNQERTLFAESRGCTMLRRIQNSGTCHTRWSRGMLYPPESISLKQWCLKPTMTLRTV